MSRTLSTKRRIVSTEHFLIYLKHAQCCVEAAAERCSVQKLSSQRNVTISCFNFVEIRHIVDLFLFLKNI